MLIFTYHLYGDAYLSTDDFNNLYWAQRQNGVQTIEHLVNPASSAVRPTGMAFYWVLFNIFHVNAAPYHWTAWLLHAINTWLVYLVLKRITGSQAGGVIGAMLFASQAAFADIYWNFGSIFELLSAMGFFVGILWWLKQPRSWTIVLACTVLFLFSLKAKEMAITLPAIWLLCDLVLQKKPFIKTAGFLLPPAALGIWFGLRKLGELGSSDPTGLHYMDLQWITLGRGLGVFFNELFNATLRWQFWSIGFAGVLLFLVLRKSRGGLFFQTYFLITFLPVIFMINHRELYLSYIPFLGLWTGLPAGASVDKVYRTETWRSFRPGRIRCASSVVLGDICGATSRQRRETDVAETDGNRLPGLCLGIGGVTGAKTK